jgi:hypothetical protein
MTMYEIRLARARPTTRLESCRGSKGDVVARAGDGEMSNAFSRYNART